MSTLVLEDLSKVYGNGFKAVSDLNMQIADGELVVLVGPSGCGKSTALLMVAGLEEISSGTLRIGERVVNDVPSHDRGIAMVIQDYPLYPHMTVEDNLLFGMKLRHVAKTEMAKRVEEAARLLTLEDLLYRKPRQLSDGERQRVAMGRAIVRDPQALLLDDPISNLDANVRAQMRAEITRIQRVLGITTMYVTHDQVEAMTMGDRVAVMHKGVLLQIGVPQNLYDHPDNLFVAGFIGSPPMNLTEATLVEGSHGDLWIQLGHASLILDPKLVAERPALRRRVGQKVAVGIRPEDMQDLRLSSSVPSERCLRATVELTEARGSSLAVHFDIDSPPVKSDDTDTKGRAEDSLLTRFVASFGPRSRVLMAETIDIAVDTGRLHFFDLATGRAIRH